MSNFQVFSMRKDGRRILNHVATKRLSKEHKVFETDIKTTNNKSLDVYVNMDSSLKGWTENYGVPCIKENHSNVASGRRNMNSIYCEILTNGNCNNCQITQRKSTSFHSSLARFPDLETGGYLLFQSLSERQKIPERTTFSALSFASAPAALHSGYSSWSESSGNSRLRSRVRAASAIVSNFNRKPIGSARLNSQPRPSTSKNVRFENNVSRQHALSLSSRVSNSSSTRKISPMSQEGWSEKQIEAWKLLAPTPPQIEVSQMNVSMYTPKELPGIKIFDESLFVI